MCDVKVVVLKAPSSNSNQREILNERDKFSRKKNISLLNIPVTYLQGNCTLKVIIYCPCVVGDPISLVSMLIAMKFTGSPYPIE